VVGSLLAGVLMYIFAFRWQSAVRERKLEMLQRFETIGRMNDRIRNALQAIECVTYATNPGATEPVRNAVDVIEGVLEEVIIDTHPVRPADAPDRRAKPSMSPQSSVCRSSVSELM